MEAEGAISQQGSDYPTPDLPDKSVCQKQHRLTCGLLSIGRTSGEIDRRSMTGQPVHDAHQRKNFDQPETGKDNLKCKGLVVQGRAVKG